MDIIFLSRMCERLVYMTTNLSLKNPQIALKDGIEDCTFHKNKYNSNVVREKERTLLQ